MKFYSPLRYPGWKNKLAKFVALVCKENNIHGHYVEPYAWGSAVALSLLINKIVSEVTINDLDRSVYAFLHVVLNNTNELCEFIEKTEVTVDNWKIHRNIQANKEIASLLELWLSTFFLNRTNVSGVLSWGIIGGFWQKGKYSIDCRFNRSDLISRVRLIAE